MANIEEQDARTALMTMVRLMVTALVDLEDMVQVHGRCGEGYVALDVSVAPGDVGKVIGKQGRTARSLRTILGAAAMKHNVRCELNIVEDRLVEDRVAGKGVAA